MNPMRRSPMILALFLSSCAITHQTSVLVGTPRPAISSDQVKLYTSPPRKYIEIAIVSADAAHDFMSKQTLLDKAVENAKAEAAKVGANGILLDQLGDTQLGSSGMVITPRPYGAAPAIGTVGTVNRTGKQVSGRAIFVTEE